MADHPPGLQHTSPGWAALLSGLIPALLFVAVHGTRRSYELLQATIGSSRESTILLFAAFDDYRDQLLLGIAAALIASLLIAWTIRRHMRSRRSPHHAR